MTRTSLLLLLALGCADEGSNGGDGGSGSNLGGDDPAEQLPLPDVASLNLPAAYKAALDAMVGVGVSRPWEGLRGAVDLSQAGCPDFYAGPPPGDDLEDFEGGAAWMDSCVTGGALTYDGYAWWRTDLFAEGSTATPEGQVVEAQRQLIGQGTLTSADEGLFSWAGEGSDALSQVESMAPSYKAWSYSSSLKGSVSGQLAFAADDPTPSGWRADLYVAFSGGSTETLSLRGDAYFFEPVIEGTFDSVSANLDWTGPLSAGPTDCALEPIGTLSIRDQNAFWYDLVFLPESSTDTGVPAACDGCGTLYIRGLDQGELCVDLTHIWNGTLQPPQLEDFVLSTRDIGLEG
jgi:hypothetical protein